MSIISEVKCARCDRKYSGVRSRCPYCGARRIGSGKYSEEDENPKGKMLVGILIMAVLVVAAGVLLFTSAPPDEPVAPSPGVSDAEESPTIGADDDTLGLEGAQTYVPPSDDTPDTEDDPATSQPLEVTSVVITYAGLAKEDFTEPVGAKIPLRVKIEPPGAEFSEEIVWASSNTSVFDVVADATDGSSALVTIIGEDTESSTATLTVSIGDVKAECIVRVGG